MRVSRAMFLLLLLYGTASAQSGNPDAARFMTEDIPRFWAAFDAAQPDFAADAFQELYLDPGSDGLSDFVEARIENAEQLAAVVRAHPLYYASIRENTQRIGEFEAAIRAAFYALKYLYPDAVFPDVYFLIGRLNSAGTTSQRALLIGAEMHGLTPDTPEDELNDWLREVLKPIDAIPHIVAHESIHYQQRFPEDEPNLLEACIIEGSADFVAELISGKHINQHIHEWANPREADLWKEFTTRMHENDYSGWLYGGAREEGRPADLGYWMGYRIAKAYYDKAQDKRQALHDILQIDDFDAFLARSGYGDR